MKSLRVGTRVGFTLGGSVKSHVWTGSELWELRCCGSGDQTEPGDSPGLLLLFGEVLQRDGGEERVRDRERERG